jgi:LAO/AO transport system kinase
LAIPLSPSEQAQRGESRPTHDDFIDRLAAGDPSTLARCITLMERGGAAADLIYRRICPRVGRATVIGFTGPPGAGKSTLIDAYIAALRTRGHSVAVAAVDPSSPISGGAVLGDRMRMRRHAEDPSVFIRSVASRGHLGGLSESIHRIVDAMDAAGRDFIIIETVGAGQSEVEVVEIADICVVVNAPNMGDEVQAMKAGILEIADVLVVNKADLPLAQRTTKQLTNMLELRRHNRDVPVLETVALTETAIDALHDAIVSRLAASAGDKRRRRERRMRRLIADCAGRIVRGLIRDAGDELADLVQAAASGEIGVDAAARRALRTVR